MAQQTLFPVSGEVFAKGYAYEAEFLSRQEEAALVEQIQRLPLAEAEYKQFRAKRRVVSYGGRYDFSAQELRAGEPIPARPRYCPWL